MNQPVNLGYMSPDFRSHVQEPTGRKQNTHMMPKLGPKNDRRKSVFEPFSGTGLPPTFYLKQHHATALEDLGPYNV